MAGFTYKPKGVCAQMMYFDIEDGIIKDVRILGGCPGNLLGISKILVNKTLDDVIEAFDGVRCGAKKTSCPDQIACALKEYKTL